MFPRIVWINWFQGWDVAPRLTRACRDSWVRRNPGWEVVALSNRTISNYVDLIAEFPAIRGKWLDPQALSDLLRIALLRRFGGVWADATVWCAQPLDAWLVDVMPSGFFAFERPGPDRMLASWFLAADTGNQAVEHWHSLCRDYWQDREVPDEYFWFHYRFAAGYKEHGALARVWDRTPKRSAGPPHGLQPLMDLPATTELMGLLSGTGCPVYKLNHRHQPPTSGVETLFDAICTYGLER